MIQANVAQGSEIWTDEWRAYRGLPGIGYVHRTVNHSVNFVNPKNGVHTNDIESRWNACKVFLKKKMGMPRIHIPTYLDEYMWPARRDKTKVFGDFVETLRHQYPV